MDTTDKTIGPSKMDHDTALDKLVAIGNKLSGKGDIFKVSDYIFTLASELRKGMLDDAPLKQYENDKRFNWIVKMNSVLRFLSDIDQLVTISMGAGKLLNIIIELYGCSMFTEDENVLLNMISKRLVSYTDDMKTQESIDEWDKERMRYFIFTRLLSTRIISDLRLEPTTEKDRSVIKNMKAMSECVFETYLPSDWCDELVVQLGCSYLASKMESLTGFTIMFDDIPLGYIFELNGEIHGPFLKHSVDCLFATCFMEMCNASRKPTLLYYCNGLTNGLQRYKEGQVRAIGKLLEYNVQEVLDEIHPGVGLLLVRTTSPRKRFPPNIYKKWSHHHKLAESLFGANDIGNIANNSQVVRMITFTTRDAYANHDVKLNMTTNYEFVAHTDGRSFFRPYNEPSELLKSDPNETVVKPIPGNLKSHLDHISNVLQRYKDILCDSSKDDIKIVEKDGTELIIRKTGGFNLTIRFVGTDSVSVDAKERPNQLGYQNFARSLSLHLLSSQNFTKSSSYHLHTTGLFSIKSLWVDIDMIRSNMLYLFEYITGDSTTGFGALSKINEKVLAQYFLKIISNSWKKPDDDVKKKLYSSLDDLCDQDIVLGQMFLSCFSRVTTQLPSFVEVTNQWDYSLYQHASLITSIAILNCLRYIDQFQFSNTKQVDQLFSLLSRLARPYVLNAERESNDPILISSSRMQKTHCIESHQTTHPKKLVEVRYIHEFFKPTEIIAFMKHELSKTTRLPWMSQKLVFDIFIGIHSGLDDAKLAFILPKMCQRKEFINSILEFRNEFVPKYIDKSKYTVVNSVLTHGQIESFKPIYPLDGVPDRKSIKSGVESTDEDKKKLVDIVNRLAYSKLQWNIDPKTKWFTIPKKENQIVNRSLSKDDIETISVLSTHFYFYYKKTGLKLIVPNSKRFTTIIPGIEGVTLPKVVYNRSPLDDWQNWLNLEHNFGYELEKALGEETWATKLSEMYSQNEYLMLPD